MTEYQALLPFINSRKEHATGFISFHFTTDFINRDPVQQEFYLFATKYNLFLSVR